MELDFLIRLTFAVHRVAQTLSKDSHLRSKITRAADRLLVSIILLKEQSKNPAAHAQHWQGAKRQDLAVRALTDLEVVSGLLQDAKRLQFLNEKNFAILEREYDTVRKLLELERLWTPEPIDEKPQQGEPPASLRALNSRQENMLEILRHKEKIQVWEIKKLLPDVTKRTLRRDLDDLLKRNLVLREGEWNDVFYRINAGGDIRKPFDFAQAVRGSEEPSGS